MKRFIKSGGALLAMATIAACSSGVGEEAEDGWGEQQSGINIMPGIPAVESDVDESELSIEDDVADDATTFLEDDELETTEDDLFVDIHSEYAPSLDVGGVPLDEPQATGCSTYGSYPKYAQGAQLVTTDWLNLRKGASTGYAIIETMKPGTAVAVLQPTCGKRWAKIKDSHGHIGWSAVDWLRPKSTPKPTGWAALYSPARGQKLASKAWSMWKSSNSRGWCLRGTRMSIAASISPGFATGSPGAHQFGVYARQHRAWMRNRHLQVYAVGENGAPKPASFPPGTVMVWSRGRCGMNATWGHVEIVVNSTVACSDHCRKRSDKSCGPDTIIIPRK